MECFLFFSYDDLVFLERDFLGSEVLPGPKAVQKIILLYTSRLSIFFLLEYVELFIMETRIFKTSFDHVMFLLRTKSSPVYACVICPHTSMLVTNTNTHTRL